MVARKKAKPNLNQQFELLTISQLSKLGMTFWVGGTLTIGAIIIPLLFKTLDQITAAGITGQILNINAYVGVVVLIFALLDLLLRHKLGMFKLRKFWYVICMLLILVVNYFAVFPIVAHLRNRLSDAVHHVIHANLNFNFWHSISAGLFVLTCILGVLFTLEKN